MAHKIDKHFIVKYVFCFYGEGSGTGMLVGIDLGNDSVEAMKKHLLHLILNFQALIQGIYERETLTVVNKMSDAIFFFSD